MKLTIFQKGVILTAIPLVSQLIFTLLVAYLDQENTRAQKKAAHSQNVLRQSQIVLRSAWEVETCNAEFILTGNPTFLQPLEETRGHVPDNLNMLEELVKEDPPQHQKVRALSRKMMELMAWHQVNEKLARAGDKERAIARIRGEEGKKLFEAVNEDMASILAEEDRINQARTSRLESLQGWQLALLLTGSLAAFLVTVMLALIFSRGISGRLELLSQNVRRLAAGQELIAPMTGQDEIAALDASFRTMAAEVLTSHEEVNRTAAEVSKLNEDLEQRVAQRTSELAEVNRDLSQKNQEVEMFVYSVSHDLRSPLVNLEGFSKELGLSGEELHKILADKEVPAAIRDQAMKLVDQSMSESIYFIQTAVRRLSRIIDALLRLSRAGRVEYQIQQVDMSHLLERIVASLRSTIAERRARVVMQTLPSAWGDATALEQVFANLVGNALNYLDPERPGCIEIGATAVSGNGDGVTYFVKDNGLGIPEGHQRKIFQAFQRAHPDRAPGEGIGLTIVRRIVERHRGKVWMDSHQNEGTVFYVTLPTPHTAQA